MNCRVADAPRNFNKAKSKLRGGRIARRGSPLTASANWGMPVKAGFYGRVAVNQAYLICYGNVFRKGWRGESLLEERFDASAKTKRTRCFQRVLLQNGGEGGIRTPGPNKPVNRFRVCRIRPLCHLSIFTMYCAIYRLAPMSTDLSSLRSSVFDSESAAFDNSAASPYSRYVAPFTGTRSTFATSFLYHLARLSIKTFVFAIKSGGRLSLIFETKRDKVAETLFKKGENQCRI